MSQKKSTKLPSVYIDENIVPGVADSFRSDFRTVEISRNSRFKGRNESDYIDELYSDNGIFVTSDAIFVNYLQNNKIKHAGVILIPEQMTASEKIFFAEIVGGFIKGGCISSQFTFRNFIFYPGQDGLRTV